MKLATFFSELFLTLYYNNDHLEHFFPLVLDWEPKGGQRDGENL